MKEQVEGMRREAAKQLATAIHAKAKEIASQRLNTRRKMFIKNLKLIAVNEDLSVIRLNAKVRWIDDGQKEHNMLDDLLKSPNADTAKDGSKYIVIPFDKSPGKGSTEATPAQQDLIATIKKEMEKR